MKAVVVVTFFAAIYTIEALECGIHISRNEHLKKIINKCVSSNKTLGDLWDITSMSSETDSSSSEEEAPLVDGKMNFRTRRTAVKSSEDNETESVNQITENCIVQCIFEHMEMTDTVGYPVHVKIADSLLKNSTNREVQDFLRDTTDACFRKLDHEDTMDPCAYSVKLVTCLVDKGRSNCSDWPIGELPFH